MDNKKSTSFLSWFLINWIQFLLNPFFSKDSLNKSVSILFEFNDSDPPLKIAVLPDLKHKEETSQATLGLLSKITPITPIGMETFLIMSPLDLFQEESIFPTGSSNLIISLIACLIFSILFLFKVNRSIKLSFSFCFYPCI